MSHLLAHLKKYITRGLIAVIPATIVLGLLYLVYDLVDKNVGRMASGVFGLDFPGIGIFLLVLVLYLFGVLVSSVGGRLVFGFLESVSQRIPLVGRLYGVGKQLSTTLSRPEKEMFRRAVLVRYLNKATWTIGFVTGSMSDDADEGIKYLTVFVPTPPNPFSGTMIIVPEAETRDPGWSIDEALQSVLSGGLLAPPSLR